jgi:hypothetical protein
VFFAAGHAQESARTIVHWMIEQSGGWSFLATTPASRKTMRSLIVVLVRIWRGHRAESASRCQPLPFSASTPCATAADEVGALDDEYD